MDIDIPRNEQGLIRVFAISRPMSDISSMIDTRGKSAVVYDLVGQELPPEGYELFPVADLSGVGLSGYLSEGYAVPDAQLAQYRSKLDALDGYVLLIFSSAFENTEGKLRTDADLTLIGTFGETQPDMRSTPMESEAAQPYTGTPRQTPATPPKGTSGSALVVLGIVVLLALVLWWVLG